MKKLLIICGLLFSVVTFANAQDGQGRRGGTPEERAKRQSEQLAEKLKLSDDQKAKVHAIYLEQGPKMRKLRDSLGDNREGFRAAMTKSNAQNEAKIAAVLTDDQKKAFTAWIKERNEAMKKRQEANANGNGNNNRR
ncbi:periplasmic heavy metal sensor [Pedobacter psychroterrae]|uniref:Periplasmic heavy metal sensor n=1 Tax=Pedobacter psychroterrae TaxID=2530453 RepID=A0A4R0NK32_9SPHI|nr:periplasmic heavy metal sensor [Pedobacter psychroterrae]TCD00906.1 periplasmic heavy metal sensor [Pedobacter psychroterrae]